MEPISKIKIMKNLVFIKENLTQIGRVMDKLIEYDLISMDEKAEILTNKSLDTQCDLLLERLIKRGGFDELVEALNISGNVYVAKKLTETEGRAQGIEREETTFMIDENQKEILELIKDKEIIRMRYEELMKKYNNLKDKNKTKSDEIKTLQQRLELLEQRQESTVGLTQQTDDDKNITIDKLKGDNEHLEHVVVTLEDKIDELKEEAAKKDEMIMKLKNEVGKLQTSIEAGKQEREKLNQELHKEMAKIRQHNDERFDRLEKLVIQQSENRKGLKVLPARNLKKANNNLRY